MSKSFILFGIIIPSIIIALVVTLVISIRRKKITGILISSLALVTIFVVLAAIIYAVEYTM